MRGGFFHQLFQRIQRLLIFAPAFSKIGVGLMSLEKEGEVLQLFYYEQ